MGTKQRAIRGVIFNWLGRCCAIAITFVLTPILVHGLGKETYGLWSVLMSLSGYYGLFNLGLRPAATKYIAQYDGVMDHASVNKVIVTSIWVYGLLGFLVLPVAAGMAYGVPRFFDVTGDSVTSIQWAVLLTGVNVAVSIWGQVFAAVLTARTRFDLIMGLNVSAKLLSAALMVAVLRLGQGLVGMAAVTLFVGVLTQLVQYILATRQLRDVSFSWSRFDYGMLKTLFNFSVLSLLVSAARQSSSYAAPLIVGVVSGPVAVTYFSIAEALVKHVRKLSKGVARVVMPVASKLESQERHEELATILILIPRFLLAIALGMAVVFFFMGWTLVELWIGEGYGKHVLPVLCVLTVGRVFTMTTNSLQAMMAGMNRMKFLSALAVIQSLIIIGGGIVLTSIFGLIGMAWAILCAQFLTSGVLLPWYACREVEYPFGRFLAKTMVPGILSAIPGLMLALCWVHLLPTRELFMLIGQILCIGMVVAFSALFICLDHKTRVAIYRAFREKRRPRRVAERGEVASPTV